MKQLDILYEDNHLLVVNKPAGIATMGAQSGPTVHSLAANYLKRAYHKPGRAFVGIVSRLDTMTSGVLVLAKTSKAASRLAPQFAAKAGAGAVKIYLAVVEGDLESGVGRWTDYLRKNDQARRMEVVDATTPEAKLADLRFLTLGQTGHLSLVAIQLLTGRKHQIRVQFADRTHGVVGDRKYRAHTTFPDGIALHSWRLQIRHPTRQEPMWFEAELPGSWNKFSHLLNNMGPLRDRVNESFDLPVDDQP